MDARRTIKFKCLALQGALLESQALPELAYDRNCKEVGYFTVDGNICILLTGGSWTCIHLSPLVTSGIKHFSMRYLESSKVSILPAFVSSEEKDLLCPLHQVQGFNAFYCFDGTTRSKGIQHFRGGRINPGEIIHLVCDFNNGIISFVLDSTKQTIGECIVPAKFKGKPMVPIIYAMNTGDKFEILP